MAMQLILKHIKAGIIVMKNCKVIIIAIIATAQYQKYCRVLRHQAAFPVYLQ